MLFKFGLSKIFLKRNSYFKIALYCAKVTVKNFTQIDISHKCSSFQLSIHQRIMEYIYHCILLYRKLWFKLLFKKIYIFFFWVKRRIFLKPLKTLLTPNFWEYSRKVIKVKIIYIFYMQIWFCVKANLLRLLSKSIYSTKNNHHTWSSCQCKCFE